MAMGVTFCENCKKLIFVWRLVILLDKKKRVSFFLSKRFKRKKETIWSLTYRLANFNLKPETLANLINLIN